MVISSEEKSHPMKTLIGTLVVVQGGSMPPEMPMGAFYKAKAAFACV